MSDELLVKSPWQEWKIETVLGHGSFGTVYRAVRIEGENRYYSAIKHISIPASQEEIDMAIKKGIASDSDSLNRFFEGIANTFINEIKVMYQLRGNTNIVLYEDHKLQKKEDSIGYEIYIRMELLHPLTSVLSNRTLDKIEVARLGADICTAISLCCAKGIVHRDIKPSNIYLSDTGNFKLGDFGSSILYRDMKNGDMISGTTPAYMAPELNAAKPSFSEQTDIYALGLVLYRLLNNDMLPFMSSDINSITQNMEIAIARRNRGERIPAPANGTPELNGIIIKAIEYLPENRYKSAEEFKKALINYTSGNSAASNNSQLEATERADYTSYRNSNQSYVSQYDYSGINNSNVDHQSFLNYDPHIAYHSPVTPIQGQATEKTKTLNLTIICATVCVLAVIIAVVMIMNKEKNTVPDSDTVSSNTSSESVSMPGDNATSSLSHFEAAEEPKIESVTEYPDPNPSNIIPVKRTSCSSHAGNGKYGRKYGSDMAVDGKPETCWMAYGVPAGKDNWIRLDFGKNVTITGIKILNGNTWNGVYKGKFIDGYDNLYEKNGRLHNFTVELSDGTIISGSAYDIKESDYNSNIFFFDRPIETKYVKIYVDSGYEGYKYKNNVCISEIHAFC